MYWNGKNWITSLARAFNFSFWLVKPRQEFIKWEKKCVIWSLEGWFTGVRYKKSFSEKNNVSHLRQFSLHVTWFEFQNEIKNRQKTHLRRYKINLTVPLFWRVANNRKWTGQVHEEIARCIFFYVYVYTRNLHLNIRFAGKCSLVFRILYWKVQ